MDPISSTTGMINVFPVDQTPTLHHGFSWVWHFLGQLALGWIPATIITISNTNNPPIGVQYYALPYGPASAEDAVNYLQTTSAPGVFERLAQLWGAYTALALFISLLLGIIVAYCIIRIEQIRKHERLKFEAAAHPIAARDVSRTQLRWNRIVEEAGSESEQNWRLAILEADIMLGELLDSLGYKGETMADKMRQVERGDFNTIDLAWEAHRARNAIAHQGLTTTLSEREARRIIGLYERIFHEFKFIG